MPFTASTESGCLWLRGELDLASTEEFQAAFLTYLDGQSELVIDLSELQFIDSSGIRAMIDVARRAAPRAVRLRSPHPNVRRVFELTGFEPLVPNLAIE